MRSQSEVAMRWSWRGLASAIVVLFALGLWPREQPLVAAHTDRACGINMRVLVIAADGQEVNLPAITDALGYIGVPFDVFVATQHPDGMPAAVLSTGCRAHYQGVILTTNELGWAGAPGGWGSAFTAADFDTLMNYEARFGIRRVNWFTNPRPDAGFHWLSQPSQVVSASVTPLNLTVTAAGDQVFPYLATGVRIPIQHATAYLATPFDATTTPLLTDGQGHALAAVTAHADGRESLSMTFDSNAELLHSILLSYGVVNWVTRGLFIGDRHVTMSAQVDDVLVDNTHWIGTTASAEGTPCGTSVDSTGGSLRMTGDDLAAVVAWQAVRRQDPVTPRFRLTLAFNGVGATGIYVTDTLTESARRHQRAFHWVSHTWAHENLDLPMDYAGASLAVSQNTSLATAWGLRSFSPINLVQPNVSGLDNPLALQAMSDHGVRYVVSDTSHVGQNNPSPNVGRWNVHNPLIFQIPRRPTNLYFNVAYPQDWVAEYNCRYRDYWGQDLDFGQILDRTSADLLFPLLRGDLAPWMFHQPNLIAYDGTDSLLTTLLDVTFAKYRTYFTLPIQTPSMDDVGARMENRTLARAHGVSGTLHPGAGVTLVSPVDVTIPVTGLTTPDAEIYGGQTISWISLRANQPRFVAMASTPGVQPPTADAGPSQQASPLASVTLTGAGHDTNVPARPLTFAWMQTSGPQVVLTGAADPVATFTAPVLAAGTRSTTLRFQLTVGNDLFSTTSTTTVVVRAPRPPAVSAGPAQVVNWSAPVTLSGGATDTNTPPLPLSWEWEQTLGPPVVLDDPQAASPTFTAPSLDVDSPDVALRFRLTVTNGAASASASTVVTVQAPHSPIARVSARQTVESASRVTLAGSGSDRNRPGLPLTFVWRQTSGPPVALTRANTATAWFTAPTLAVGAVPVKFGFTLTVSNGVGQDSATTIVTVVARSR